jgi:hypothetical protein
MTPRHLALPIYDRGEANAGSGTFCLISLSICTALGVMTLLRRGWNQSVCNNLADFKKMYIIISVAIKRLIIDGRIEVEIKR